MGKITAVFETDCECSYDNEEPKKGKFTTVFETDAECECHCHDDYIPSSFAEAETVDMKLNYFNEQIDSIDINATGEVENDGGDPEVVVTKTGDNHLQPIFDFIFKNVIGPRGPAGPQGESGEDGFSPTISITDITGGHRVTITDAEGTESFDILNGINGQDGNDGQDGYSPTIAITDITGGHRVTVTDVNGSRSFDVLNGINGQDGDDGFSPIVTVTDITGGHRVSITDATGTQTFDVMNGEKGDPGDVGAYPNIDATATVDGNTGVPSVVVTATSSAGGADVDFAFAFSNLKGQKGDTGQSGSDGADGYSPTVSVDPITGGNRVSITDATGTETFDVMNGSDGSTGPAGPAGPAGQNGNDGVSPAVSITNITDGHRVTITDKDHPTGQSFDVMNGSDGSTGPQGPAGQGVPTGGAAGQVLAKASGTDYDTEWITPSGGGSPQIDSYDIVDSDWNAYQLMVVDHSTDAQPHLLLGFYQNLSSSLIPYNSGNKEFLFDLGSTAPFISKIDTLAHGFVASHANIEDNTRWTIDYSNYNSLPNIIAGILSNYGVAEANIRYFSVYSGNYANDIERQKLYHPDMVKLGMFPYRCWAFCEQNFGGDSDFGYTLRTVSIPIPSDNFANGSLSGDLVLYVAVYLTTS